MERRRMKSLGKTAKQGVAWSFLREGVTEIVVFPASMVLARLLTPREFGIAVAALFFVQLSSKLSELGFNAAIVRAKVVEPIHLSSVFVVNLAVGVITFAALVAAAPAVAAFYRQPETGQILPIAAVTFLIAPFGAVPAGILTRELQFRESARIDWYQSVTFAVMSPLLAWLGFSYMSTVYARIASVFVQTLTRMYFAGWRPSLAFSRLAVAEVMSFGTGVWIKRLLDYLAQNVDNLVVGRFFGMVTLGFYDKAYSTMNRFLVRMNTDGPVVTFRIFSMIHEEPERFRRAYRKVVMSTSLLGYPAFMLLAAAAPQLIAVLFGDRWLPAAGPFRVLCIAAVLKLLNSYASAATQAVGRVWAEVWRQLIYIGLIVGGLIAFREYGPVGAASAVLFATATMMLLMHVLLRRVTSVRWVDMTWPQVPGLLCGVAVGLLALAVDYAARSAAVPRSGLLVLLVQVLAAGILYLTFVLFAPLADMRALVWEITQDLVPSSVKRLPIVKTIIQWQALPPPPSPSSV
jgi:teichuronic acid exporter